MVKDATDLYEQRLVSIAKLDDFSNLDFNKCLEALQPSRDAGALPVAAPEIFPRFFLEGLAGLSNCCLQVVGPGCPLRSSNGPF